MSDMTACDLDTEGGSIGRRHRYPDRHPVVTGAETPATTRHAKDFDVAVTSPATATATAAITRATATASTAATTAGGGA
jgi:hypothetical protein